MLFTSVDRIEPTVSQLNYKHTLVLGIEMVRGHGEFRLPDKLYPFHIREPTEPVDSSPPYIHIFTATKIPTHA